jgi:hypothetical protein
MNDVKLGAVRYNRRMTRRPSFLPAIQNFTAPDSRNDGDLVLSKSYVATFRSHERPNGQDRAVHMYSVTPIWLNLASGSSQGFSRPLPHSLQKPSGVPALSVHLRNPWPLNPPIRVSALL